MDGKEDNTFLRLHEKALVIFFQKFFFSFRFL